MYTGAQVNWGPAAKVFIYQSYFVVHHHLLLKKQNRDQISEYLEIGCKMCKVRADLEMSDFCSHDSVMQSSISCHSGIYVCILKRLGLAEHVSCNLEEAWLSRTCNLQS